MLVSVSTYTDSEAASFVAPRPDTEIQVESASNE